MNGHRKRTNLTTSGMAAVLSCLLFFSCNNEDILEDNSNITGNACDNICFGISPDGNVQTRGNTVSGEDGYTSERFVLRSQDSADTLCVRAIVSDGIHSPVFEDRQAITRGTPVSKDNFYDSFHVLAYWKKNGTLVEEQFYMDADVTKKGNNLWSSDRTYYWPGVEHTLRFYAWAPVSGAFETVPTTPESTTLTYTVPSDAADQKDIVVASPDETPGNYNAAQSLTFNHICTAVRFVTGSQMQPGTIRSVTLKGVRYNGSYDLATGEWTLNDDVINFTQSLDKEMSGSETDGTEVATGEATFMMLPQTLPTGAKVEVVFHSNVTGEERTLEAIIGGMEWPQGQTVTYNLSISPEYELEFTSEPEIQDAHYVIYPIHIKAEEIPGGWTMSSTDPDNVTLHTDLTILTRRGFWIEEDKGWASISSTATGEDITVYAFLTENITDETREVSLELRPTNMPDAQPQTFTISQLCPSWNGNLGCERLEDGEYPWGFLWPTGMTITYEMENAGLGDLIKNALLNAYLSWFTDYNDFITKETWILSIKSVTINYDKVPQVNVAKAPDNGLKNTMELYNFNGLSDVSTLISILEDWGGTTTDVLPLNPDEFAARACAMKNKYNKTVETQPGTSETIQVPVLKEENLVWYLPAKNEASQMKDETYPLQGEYWTSTVASTDENDNENAYKYTAGGSTNIEKRDVNLRVRAVRKKP